MDLHRFFIVVHKITTGCVQVVHRLCTYYTQYTISNNVICISKAFDLQK